MIDPTTGNGQDDLADTIQPLTKEEVAEATNLLLAEGLIEVVGHNEGGEPIYNITDDKERSGKPRVD